MSHDLPEPPVRSVAEEARTLVAARSLCSLATLSEDGTPWASVVSYVPTETGAPVLCVSTLAEHGRNLEREQRGSVVVAEEPGDRDPIDCARVTLAGRFRRPDDDEEAAARRGYHGLADFSSWVLDVERVRWVGGFARMGSAGADEYRAAEPDPTAASAAHAVAHLNEDHADALLVIAQRLAGHRDAVDATCLRIDRYGLDLRVTTPGGAAWPRVGFAAPAAAPDGLRAATVELTRRAREAAASV